MLTTQVGTLFRDGKLTEAIEAASASVKQSPTDAGARILLAELLLFGGDFERADSVLDAAQAIDPTAAIVVAEFCQLLRAARVRRQVIRDGRVPEFLGGPTESQQLLLRALVQLRSGDRAAAAHVAAEAEDSRTPVSGTSNGTAFADFRDVDDLVGGNLEVLTTTGKYFWIPVEHIGSMEFHVAKRPRDLFWRRCSMMVRGGPEGDVYLPALYETDAESGIEVRLGRATEWIGPAPFRGSGQRMFLVGEEGVPIHELTTIEFDA
jgi:type VI secretion system protein ImpE